MTQMDTRTATLWRHALIAVPAAIGAVLGAYAYFGSETGVDGTGGALLAMLGAAAVALAGLVRPAVGLGRVLLDILIALGAALTAFAAWMLMQDAFALAMLASLIGLAVALLVPSRRTPA
jgi:quinoprotein glucose dehydrogenase